MIENYLDLLIQKENYVKDNQSMIIAGIITVLLAYFMVSSEGFQKENMLNWSTLLTIYGVAFYTGFSFLAGWKLLEGFTSRYFIALPIIGWVFYWFLKVAFALIVGVNCFYGVFRFFRNLYKIYKINQALKEIVR